MLVNLVPKKFIMVKLSLLKIKKLRKKIQKISEEEKIHFDYFNEQILKYRVRPSLMSPLWSLLGNTIGAVSSRLGEDYVNACTESVEEIIVAITRNK